MRLPKGNTGPLRTAFPLRKGTAFSLRRGAPLKAEGEKSAPSRTLRNSLRNVRRSTVAGRADSIREQQGRTAYDVSTDLPAIVQVTDREVDVLFWHSRDLVETLLSPDEH